MRIAKRFLLFAGLLLPLSGFAQWNVSAYVGKTHTLNAGLNVSQSPDASVVLKNIGFDDRSFHAPLYYGLRAGYLIKPSTGFEAELIHVKAFARLPPDLAIQQYKVSHGLNLLLGNLVLRRKVVRRVTISFRSGLGVAIAHPEVRAFGLALERYERQGLAVQFAAGADFEITKRVFWLGEYKFTTTKPRFAIGPATIENTFSTHHIVSGLGLRF